MDKEITLRITQTDLVWVIMLIWFWESKSSTSQKRYSLKIQKWVLKKRTERIFDEHKFHYFPLVFTIPTQSPGRWKEGRITGAGYISLLSTLPLLDVYNRAVWKHTKEVSVKLSSIESCTANPASGLMLARDNKSVERTKKFPWKVCMERPREKKTCYKTWGSTSLFTSG